MKKTIGNVAKRGVFTLFCVVACTAFFGCFGETEENSTVKTPTEGLQFEISEDGSYYSLVGIGTATDADIVVPSTYELLPVKYVAQRAFISNATLESIVIPQSVEGIGEYAFYNCMKLESVAMGNGVTDLGSDVFRGCENLKEIELSANLKEIPIQAFSQCYRLTEVEIPQGVTKIETDAFRVCSSLNKVVLPTSLLSIGTHAFFDSTSLKTITYRGTTAQWERIQKGENFAYRSAKEVKCSNGSLAID